MITGAGCFFISLKASRLASAQDAEPRAVMYVSETKRHALGAYMMKLISGISTLSPSASARA